MLRLASCLVIAVNSFVFAACSSRSLPKYEKPIARARVQQVRTTAYTHSEADHLQHGRRNALGTTLQYGEVKSAAADWSRWPAGTIFRILETGEIYEVDDYGWALAGTNTIDLYKPSRSAMNQWGVRRVTIEHLVWGDVDRSLAILRERQRFKHVRRMLDQIEERYAELKEPLEPPEQIVEPAQRMVSEPEPEPAPPGPRHTPSVAAVSTRSASSANPSARLVPFQSTTR